MREIRDCNVAVVGGAGFLGSHLVRELINRSCNVLIIDNLVSGRKEFIPENSEHDPRSHGFCKFEYADITGSESYLLSLFKNYKIDYVFNYAAYPYIPVSFERPLHVFNVNAFGALKVINAAQEAGVKGILQVSSAEIYGDGTTYDAQKLDEKCPVAPHSSYGASKAAIDAMVQVRWKEAQTPVIALRQFNCVGERETHPYVIPEIIQQLSESSTIYLGNNSSRDFQYAGDAVAMSVELLEKGNFGEVYNMGSEDVISIWNLAYEISRIMRPTEATTILTDEARVRPWEIWHLQSDNSKLYSVIDKRPTVSFQESLRRTIDDFRDNGERWCWS